MRVELSGTTKTSMKENSKIKKSSEKIHFGYFFNTKIESVFMKMWQVSPRLLHLHLLFIVVKKPEILYFHTRKNIYILKRRHNSLFT